MQQRVSTVDFVVGETEEELVVVSKDTTEGVKYMTKAKEHHTKFKDPPKYTPVPHSNMFVSEWNKLYMVYYSHQHSLRSCLLL